jgi:hypothetical protein
MIDFRNDVLDRAMIVQRELNRREGNPYLLVLLIAVLIFIIALGVQFR